MNRAIRVAKKLRNRFSEISDISEELTIGLSKIVILGSRECLIENYRSSI